MSKKQFSDQDTFFISEGDATFTGVNDKVSPELLPVGFVAAATNKIFVDGRASTRFGCVTLKNMDIGSTTACYGASVFGDPDGLRWVLVATASKVYRLRWDSAPRETPIRSDSTLSDRVFMLSALDRILMFGADILLEWRIEGTINVFKGYPDEAESSYTLMPQADHACLSKNRIWAPFSNDTIAVSNVLEYYQYDAVMNEYRVGAGGDDGAITRVFPFTQNSVIVFKQFGTYIITNIIADTDGEIATNLQIELLSTSVGCIARDSVQLVGKEVFFLSRSGVRRVSQQIQGLIEPIIPPVSDAIEGTIDRINWEYAEFAASAFDGRFYYLAVPLDTATTNTTILVYDARSGNWMGSHTFPSGVQFDYLVVGEYQYNDAVYGVNATNADVYLLYNGYSDRINGTVAEVSDSVTTRGYLMGKNEPKSFRNLRVALDTWDPTVTISLKVDGVGEQDELVSDKTFDNTKYNNFGMTAWVASNVNDDHNTPHRQDYSISTATPFYMKSGLQFDLHQNIMIGCRTKKISRFAQVVIENTTGRCELISVGVDGFEKRRYHKDKL